MIVKLSALVSVIAVPHLMVQAPKLVNKWNEPIEILTAAAAIHSVVIFFVSMVPNWLAGSVRRIYGLRAN